MYRDEHQRDFARALRNQPTDAEKRLWRLLRAQQLCGRKFRRQAAIGAYTVDFVCFSHKLIIELDGPQHVDPSAAEYDARRTQWLSSRSFQVMRFRNQELNKLPARYLVLPGRGTPTHIDTKRNCYSPQAI